MEFPYPLLVCDIGGTNVRIAAVDEPGGPLGRVAKYKTAAFPGFSECVEHALRETGAARPLSILACGAGPVAKRGLHLTNAAWSIDGPQIAYQLGLSQGILFNDFEAQALALPAHRPEWLHAIGPDLPREGGPQIVLGPGTGLGVAALVREGGKYMPLASEAAHIEFGPATDVDAAIWPCLERFHGRITAEAVISGPGLARLHKARAAAAGKPDEDTTPTEIVSAALLDHHGPEADSVRHFWRLTARFAGDMALVFLARNGVALSGGVLPRIIDLLDGVEFRGAFEAKAPMEHVLRQIPTWVVTAPDVVLAGLAAIAAQPGAYQIDYRQRAWR
ncbi:MAG: glucokinase [Hyphomicrobiales bacterium]|nr:glucokinase [Hyphomicrobiales bacterium]